MQLVIAMNRILVCCVAIGFSTAALANTTNPSTFEGAGEGLPSQCAPFASVPADAKDETPGWNQLLSLAACLQDTSITQVTRTWELEGMVDRYTRALELSIMIDVKALQSAPGPVQVRAAYQIAMFYVNLMVRARSSIRPGTDPEAVALRAELEVRLQPAAKIAWISLTMIDRAVMESPGLAPDPVTRNIVRSARALLEILPPARTL